MTKVLDGFRFSNIQIAGYWRGRVGFWFVQCFAGGILIVEFKTYRIIMYTGGTMEGPTAARRRNIVKILKGVGGILENHLCVGGLLYC